MDQARQHLPGMGDFDFPGHEAFASSIDRGA